MLNKFHKYPCVAYVTEPKGCKLKYGQRVEVLYLSGNGRYAITKHGRYETIRFSKEPPSDFLINPQPYVPEKRQGFFIKSYKQLYYELLERAKGIRYERNRETILSEPFKNKLICQTM
jgi:hypothetical protein